MIFKYHLSEHILFNLPTFIRDTTRALEDNGVRLSSPSWKEKVRSGRRQGRLHGGADFKKTTHSSIRRRFFKNDDDDSGYIIIHNTQIHNSV